MRKLSLLLFTIILFGNAYAAKYSDKTYLSVRPHLSNLAMQQTTWHVNLYKKPDAKYNGTIQVVPFYQESTNKTDIGKYFGFDWHNDDATRGIENIISVESPETTAGPNGSNKVFSSRYIIHNYNSANTLAADYKMDPYQEAYGLRIDYHQDLDKILNGLYFRVSTPLMEVRNNINISKIESETTQAIPGISGTNVSFLDYLAGRVENVVSTHNLQQKLKYAKIDGGSHSSSGFADIDARLGWKYLYKRRAKASLNLGVVIPTGKTPKGEWLFEPVHGNGHHWGIGLGLDFSVTLWRKFNKAIEFMIAGDYKYLFQGIEKRTLDYKLPNPNTTTYVKGGHYVLAGESGQAGVFPFANVLTKDIKVTPASQFDGIANLSLKYNNWVVDLGYNFFVKEKEEIYLRYPWENDKYAISGITYDTTSNFNLLVNGTTQSYAYDSAADGTNAAIQENYLDFESIRSPNAVTNKIYGGIGYQWNKYKYPAMLAIGGSYEFVQRNSALEGWAAWAKVGVSW